ncbi:MAG TPA: DoxX family protein [Burkholderiales bacterium]|nr:DoxX family protein [Burkholderiales bacterium]
MTRDLAALVARVLLVLLFLLSGVGKVMAFGGTVSYIASRGLPLPALETAIAVAVELGAGLLLLVGWKTRWASMILAVFAVATGILFHAYWADTDAAARMGDYINFWKNISIAGGFLMAFAFGPGGYSVDRG